MFWNPPSTPLSQCSSCRASSEFLLNSGAIIQATNLSFGILCPSPSICVTMGTGKPITVQGWEPPERKSTELCSSNKKKKSTPKIKANSNENWQSLVGCNFLQYCFFRNAKSINVIRGKQKWKVRSLFPALWCHTQHLNTLSLLCFSPLQEYSGK